MRTRDLTQAQFDKECAERGFKPQGFMGYYAVTNSLHVSIFNAGPRRRDRLAYLIKCRDSASKN